MGEEGIFEVSTAPRKDTAIAEGDAYVFEIIKDNFERMKDELAKQSQPLDWFTLSNHLKKQWTTKRGWRLYKEHEASDRLKLF